MSSLRRVKKGPGRRPQSAKRQRFMELRARGWSIRAAGREVGISRSSANNWARGHKTYRGGKVVGFVPALDRLAVRQISPRYLSQDERIEIADLRRAGLSIRQIADKIGRAPSTVSRELRRNGRRDGTYRPFEAHRWAVMRRARRHPRRVETNPELGEAVRRVACSALESAANCPASAPPISRRSVDVVVPREHLPSRLSVWLTDRQTLENCFPATRSATHGS